MPGLVKDIYISVIQWSLHFCRSQELSVISIKKIPTDLLNDAFKGYTCISILRF